MGIHVGEISFTQDVFDFYPYCVLIFLSTLLGSIVQLYDNLVICSFIDEHLGYFQFRTITMKATYEHS
jgi:hypothetical protein